MNGRSAARADICIGTNIVPACARHERIDARGVLERRIAGCIGRVAAGDATRRQRCARHRDVYVGSAIAHGIAEDRRSDRGRTDRLAGTSRRRSARARNVGVGSAIAHGSAKDRRSDWGRTDCDRLADTSSGRQSARRYYARVYVRRDTAWDGNMRTTANPDAAQRTACTSVTATRSTA